MDVSFNTEDVVVYIASAGSGKTTALMTELTELLKTYRPQEIAFTTFTRKGVMTGIERALNSNANLAVEDLMYFQTLHRMCFHESGLKRKNIIEPRDVRRFNELLGFNLHMGAAFDLQSDDDKMLQRYDAERSCADTGIYIHAMYDEERYHRFVNAYETFKRENDLVDFYDCLLRYKEVGKPLPVAVMCLDECQDITPLQWEVIQLASQKAEKIRIAGDWAQSLFTYTGADPKILLGLAEKYPTRDLNTTYRLPRRICKVADSIIDLMQVKRPRVHIPAKAEEGSVQEIAEREVLYRIIKKDWDTGVHEDYRWFLLFRTNGHIASVAEALERLCIPYHMAQGFCLSEQNLNKIRRYMKYREVGYGSDEAKTHFMREFGITDLNNDWTESNLIPGERKFVYADYIAKYGLEALAKMCYAPPFCLLTTVHRVKGAEARNVAFFLDATKQVSANLMVSLDSEAAVFYVACTRAKEKLFIVNAQSKYNLQGLWEGVVDNMGAIA